MSQLLLNQLKTLTDTPVPAGIRIAQVVGVTSAAYLSGYIACFSIVGVPSLARAPPSARAQTWQDMYKIGASTAPYLAILSSISFGYLASTVPRTPELFKNNSSRTFYLYTLAAILVPVIVPYTVGVMKPTNDQLHARADKYRLVAWDVKEDEELDDLLKEWTALNITRSLPPLAAAVVGLWAVVY
ncbi:hypothetical protein EG327_008534 [Venturia inaequalis]|uniref:DUF1772-domain-containing protein n=1 Tax=Venturia inaequalis TaxID=5025 RepID=A0A8H3UQE7_VENIN|nr:hypothetical protein EG327_008534 [Venturia inaequalis]